ncbi:Unknown protein sequence [Pseudomonas syringae pv. maculicola]|nr:Unknown protein sequence [Pseudomonas syringae pv. maculicola]
MARGPRAGQPTVGEWIGLGAPLPSGTSRLQKLTIDTSERQ